MKFYSKKEINDYFEGKTVAVVGSAPSVLENVGGYIDSHDLVVRVNNYKIKGYEDNVGRRCDVHYSFYGSSVKKTPEELLGDGVKLCMCKCPNDKPFHSEWHEQNGLKYGVDFRYIYKKKRDWWFCDTYIPETEDFMRQFEMLNKHIPSTGFSCIETILNTNASRIYITGFDFFESKRHNVDETWRQKNNNDPYGHVPAQEKKLVLSFKKKDDRIRFDPRLTAYEAG